MLKSGGPKMTVVDNNRKMGAFSDQDACYCMWWNDQKYDYATFPNVCLFSLDQQPTEEPQILNEIEDDGFWTHTPANPKKDIPYKKYILRDDNKDRKVFYMDVGDMPSEKVNSYFETMHGKYFW